MAEDDEQEPSAKLTEEKSTTWKPKKWLKISEQANLGLRLKIKLTSAWW